MKLKISFRHMEHTPALDAKIEEKCAKLERYLGKDAFVDWTCISDKHEQVSDVRVHFKGLDLHAHASSADLYKTFDVCIQKLEHQLDRALSKRI